MASDYFQQMKENEDSIKAFLLRQQSAPTVTLMGPTGSAKSTLITELLPPESNKLLSRNIGDTAQTTLIPTRLMLNDRFEATEVFIRVILKPERTGFADFRESLQSAVTGYIYEHRDEFGVEEFDHLIETDDELAGKILNPINRAFHVYDFVEKEDMLTDFLTKTAELCKDLVLAPRLITEDADALFKKLRKDKPTIKKLEAYERLIDERIGQYCGDNVQKLIEWYDRLETAMQKSLNIELKRDDEKKAAENFLADLSLEEDLKSANALVGKLYAKESPYSLILEEIIYAARPSEGLIGKFTSYSDLNRTVKINVLDTVGLTQTSQQDQEAINAHMDAILSRKSDALLFLCAADEQPSVYDTCIELLREKKRALEKRVVVVCRTKADIVIRNIMRNTWKRDHGTNIDINSEGYDTYVSAAHDAFVKENIEAPRQGEEKLGCESDSRIQYLSLTPDSTADLEGDTKTQLSPNRLFDILFDIAERVDHTYGASKDRMWLQSKELTRYPLNVAFSGDHLTGTIALAAVTKDRQDGKQYTQYIDKTDVYHGRSVNCFRHKLSNGKGHETNAEYYGNFRLFIPNMAERWLREIIPHKEMLLDFDISFEFLRTEINENKKEQIRLDFKDTLANRWSQILGECARSVSYESLRPEFERCFQTDESWSDSFRRSLRVIHEKFSDAGFWERELKKLFKRHTDEILQKMYVFD
jgi:hypothetical protein